MSWQRSLSAGFLALLALPASSAHSGQLEHGWTETAVAGGLLVIGSTRGELPVMGDPLDIYVSVLNATTRLPLAGRSVQLRFADEGPTGAGEVAEEEGDLIFREHRFKVRFPSNGTFLLRGRILPDNVTVPLTVSVYDAIPYRVDFFSYAPFRADAPTRAIFTLERWPERTPWAGVRDAYALAEEWSPDASRMLRSIRMPLLDQGNGHYILDSAFPAAGTYRLYFAAPSLDIAPRTTPPARVVVAPADSVNHLTSIPPWGLLLAAALLASCRGRPSRDGDPATNHGETAYALD